ncbi:nicotinamide riboside transporter PnuC [uncultured Sanguibacteroides sp.]|uniref:nicotinamide riboside transporter PnuC n=1 Tax=uncultured Sanguibacteroides sp. TaxID=1635151 RepID=UPI0025F4FF56|nr:nicotinamide riboside transporter PnuC [uncultured Sanguibacteroides sp.]
MEHFLEYFGVVTGIIYLILEILQHRAMWVVGFLTSFVYVFVFFFSKFYADMSLNVYYVCMSVYGFWQWQKVGSREEEKEIAILYRHLNLKLFLGIITVTVILYGVLFQILANYTDSPVPAGDAFTTALSITATWMLARRILEHWWFWVVINFVSVYLYYQRGLYPTCFLFICYGVLAVVGWINWRKKGILYDGKL